MTEYLRLATRSQGTLYDLLAGSLVLVDQSWQPRTAAPQGEYGHSPYGSQPAFDYYPPVVETFDLYGKGSPATLRAAVDQLADMFAQARLWHTSIIRPESVWLEWSTDGETAKRALVYEGAFQILAARGIDAMLANTALTAALWLRVSLTRHPFWEAISATTESEGNLSLWGEIWPTDAAVPGNEPARIATFKLEAHTGGGGPIYRIWAGFRDPYQGTTDFQALWEAETGTPGTDAAKVSEPTASPLGGSNNSVLVTFSTMTLVNRLSITLAQRTSGITTNYHHFVGRYLVLCRCRVSTGTTVGLQLRTGYLGNSVYEPCEEVYVDNTAWRLIPLGEITIPPSGFRSTLATTAYITGMQMQIWAERMTAGGGTDTVELDALLLVPSEHLFYCEGSEIQYVAGDTRPVIATVYEDDTTAAIACRNTVPALNVDYGFQDFYLPAGSSPILVVAGERATEHLTTDAVNMTITYYPRWLAHRDT